jgi:hypothetical protein
MVRAYIIFGGTGPILVVTRNAQGMQSEDAQERLEDKGIKKYIAFEVPPARAEERYGTRYSAAASRLVGDEDIRVVDVDGHQVFSSFEFREMGEPVFVGEGDRVSK